MSASDADRMLSTRSYPEGYGPAGFETGHLQGEIHGTTVYQHSGDQGSPVPEPESVEDEDSHMLYPGNAATTMSQYPSHDDADSMESPAAMMTVPHQHGYTRSPLPSLHLPSYLQPAMSSNESQYSHYSESPGLPRHLPLIHSVPYDAVYSPGLHSPPLHFSSRLAYDRPIEAFQPMYVPHNGESEFMSSVHQPPSVHTPYGPYIHDEHFSKYQNPELTSGQYSALPNRVHGLAEGTNQYYYPGSMCIPSISTPRPFGYSSYPVRLPENSYSDVRDSQVSEHHVPANDNHYNMAPRMQREVKYFYGRPHLKHESDEQLDDRQPYGPSPAIYDCQTPDQPDHPDHSPLEDSYYDSYQQTRLQPSSCPPRQLVSCEDEPGHYNDSEMNLAPLDYRVCEESQHLSYDSYESAALEPVAHSAIERVMELGDAEQNRNGS